MRSACLILFASLLLIGASLASAPAPQPAGAPPREFASAETLEPQSKPRQDREQQQEQQQLQDGPPVDERRARLASARLKLARLFEFARFKRAFHKSYASLLEESARLKYFMGCALRAFNSVLAYARSGSSYYLAINGLSDASPAELAAMVNRELLAASSADDGDGGGAASAAHATLRQKRSLFDFCGSKGATLAGPFKRMRWEMLAGGGGKAETLSAGKPDEVFVDHSAAGCMLEPRDQSQCGACYAFASIAYFEWLSCARGPARSLAPLSEQFIIDCGPGRLTGLAGCQGGTLTSVGEFALNFGLELRLDYGFKLREDTCPYGLESALKSTGYLKVRGLESGSSVPMELWARHLRYGPMLVLVSTASNWGPFREYGGGVYGGAGCHERHTDHVMLLVGHGREDGREYWLLRNSYGPNWGERGYMKLAKSANCIHPSVGFMFGTRDGGKTLDARPALNRAHDRARVRAHYSSWLAGARGHEQRTDSQTD